jgi:hypothetical protein
MIISDRSLRQSAARRGYSGFGSFGGTGIPGMDLLAASDAAIAQLRAAGVANPPPDQVADVAKFILANTAGVTQDTSPRVADTGLADRGIKFATDMLGLGTKSVSPSVGPSGTRGPGGLYAPPPSSGGFLDSFPLPLLIGGGLIAAALVYKVTRKKTA